MHMYNKNGSVYSLKNLLKKKYQGVLGGGLKFQKECL